PNINKYFKELQKNKHTNFSRKQSPGMLYAMLKDEGPLKSIVDDYATMHGKNFLSYYRDADGTFIGQPQVHDSLVDLVAKVLDAGLQLIHKYRFPGFILKPVIEPFLGPKQESALQRKDSLQPLRNLKGITTGFLWQGIAKGVLESTVTPYYMLADFINLLT